MSKLHMPSQCISYTSRSGLSRAHLLTGLHEVWEDGQAFKDLHARMRMLAESKASLEAARKVCDCATLMQVLDDVVPGKFRVAIE